MTRARISDRRRLQALAATGLLEAPGAAGLDRLANLAARALGVPQAYVTLIDADRQLLAGAAGPVLPVTEREGPLSLSFCQHVVHCGGPVIIDDARDDQRVCETPAVSQGQVLAYAGYPLTSPDGQVLGSFCLVDTRPRQWSAAELDSLADFAAAAESEIALRGANDRLTAAAERLAAVLDATQDAYTAIDVAGDVLAWNAAAEKLFGWTSAEALGMHLTSMIVPERFRAKHDAGLERVRRSGESKLAGRRLQLAAVDRDGREFPIELTLQADGAGGEMRFHAFLHDISEREEQRRALETERSFLQALLDNMDAGVIACGADGELALTNQAMRGFYGVPDLRGDQVGAGREPHRLYERDGHTPVARDRTPLARAFAGDTVAGDEVMIRYADGSARRFACRGRQLRGADGAVQGAVVVVQDVTDRERRDRLHAAQHAAARVLAEAPSYTEAARAVVEAVGAALGWTVGEYWEVDEERQVIVRVGSWVTERAAVARFTGPERLSFQRGQGLPGLGWESGRTEWVVDMATDPRTFIRGGIAAEEDLHAAVVMPIRSPDAVLGILLFVTDHAAQADAELMDMLDGVGAHLGRYIERRRTEELRLALADARDDLDRVVRQISDFIWTVEVAPGGTLLPVYSSPNAAHVFGHDVVPGPDLAAVVVARVHPADAPGFAEFMAAVAERPASIEVRIRGFDDVTRWVWFRANPRRSGDRLFADGVCTDVTEQHRLAERREDLLVQEREQVRQLRAVDRLKDELVALVTHELRNPIASIHGFTELLLDEAGGLRPEHQKFVAAIGRQSSHLQRLVDDLLELARLDAGQVPIAPEATALGPLVQQVLDNHRPAADSGRITMTAGLDPGITVLADPLRLRQVLDNLMSNAIKYTTAGGAVRLGGIRDGDRVLLSIVDTGIGIPADEYPKLFTRFFRASTAIEGNVDGTGLGLAITKAIVERHGGTIDARPNDGGGTVFTVSLLAA